MITPTSTSDSDPIEPPPAPIVRVEGLGVEFRHRGAWARAVDDVSLDLAPSRTTTLLGESGSGKSVTARALLGLLPAGRSRVTGRVLLGGPPTPTDLLALDDRELRRHRGRDVAMVFQDALSALNPVLSVGHQVAEPCRLHLGLSRRAARARAAELLDLVGIPDAGRRVGDYPHQFSGGMLQRVMIAQALAADPDVLIADEPTTALDVTVQAQILDLLLQLQEERRMSLLLITHDMGVVAQVADDVAVMYAGRVVEQGPADAVLGEPRHPYTRALLESVPRAADRGSRLRVIPGTPPDLGERPGGCAFRPRCREAQHDCSTPPALVPVGHDRLARCHLAGSP